MSKFARFTLCPTEKIQEVEDLVEIDELKAENLLREIMTIPEMTAGKCSADIYSILFEYLYEEHDIDCNGEMEFADVAMLWDEFDKSVEFLIFTPNVAKEVIGVFTSDEFSFDELLIYIEEFTGEDFSNVKQEIDIAIKTLIENLSEVTRKKCVIFQSK